LNQRPDIVFADDNRFPPGFDTSIEVAAVGVHFGKKHPDVA
jgi:hypothetical protein